MAGTATAVLQRKIKAGICRVKRASGPERNQENGTAHKAVRTSEGAGKLDQ